MVCPPQAPRVPPAGQQVPGEGAPWPPMTGKMRARTRLRGTSRDQPVPPANNFHGRKKPGGSDHPSPPARSSQQQRGLAGKSVLPTNSHPRVKSSSLPNHGRALQAIATCKTNFPRFIYLLVFENELVGAENRECQL